MKRNILVINPGSTSTKISVFDYCTDEEIYKDTIYYSSYDLGKYSTIIKQKYFRKKDILNFLNKHNVNLDSLIAVVGRGGMLKPIPSGTYIINDAMIDDLQSCKYGSHASNLGGILAKEIASTHGIDAFIVDPVVVDEMDDIARISGFKGINRRSVIHALNQKTVARKVLKSHSLTYENSKIIVAHMGGGISIGVHKHGRIIDLTNAFDGEGPMSPERTGYIPLIQFYDYISNNKLSHNEIKKMVAGNGGLVSYLNTNNIESIEHNIKNGDLYSKKILDALCYQISKSIGELATVLRGDVDMIILTGGISHSNYITKYIEKQIGWISTVNVFPGELEMMGLYEGVKRVLEGIENIKTYN